ncbi:MAG: DUF4340 domain-containing protein [Acidobacteria bacterium]|nr:DUF4340 domain-containing protein [Acidobacteriota bacterium]
MKSRGLIIAVVVAAALGGGIWYSEKLEAEKAAKPPADTAPKLIEMGDDQFKKLEISKKDTPALVLERGADNKWKMLAPQTLPVDTDAITALTNTLASFASERLVEEKATDLAQFGLVAPSLKVAITTKDGKTRSLLVGDETATGGGFYAKMDSDARVYTIFNYNRAAIDKSPSDLRDKRLMTFDPLKVTRVELTAQKTALEFGKNAAGEWQILKPDPYRADNLQVEEIVRKLKDAKMDLALATDELAKASAQFASGAVVAAAKVTDAGGTQTLEVRKNKDDFFAKSSAVEGVWKVAKELGEGLDKPLDDLRNKKLFDFGFSDPSKVEFRFGDSATALAKAGEDWTRSGKKMDAAQVQTLIDKLRDLTAIKFMTTGFAAPSIEITVTAKQGEKVQISQADGRWVARRDGEAALYELDGKNVQEIERAVKELKEASAAPPKK